MNGTLPRDTTDLVTAEITHASQHSKNIGIEISEPEKNK